MECNRDGVAAAEVDDVAIPEIPLVDLLVVDVGPVRGVAIDEEDLSVDRDDLGMQPRDLRIFQYDLTNRRLAPDADAGAAEAQALAGAGGVEDRELGEERAATAPAPRDPHLRGPGHGELPRLPAPAHPHRDGYADADECH